MLGILFFIAGITFFIIAVAKTNRSKVTADQLWRQGRISPEEYKGLTGKAAPLGNSVYPAEKSQIIGNPPNCLPLNHSQQPPGMQKGANQWQQGPNYQGNLQVQQQAPTPQTPPQGAPVSYGMPVGQGAPPAGNTLHNGVSRVAVATAKPMQGNPVNPQPVYEVSRPPVQQQYPYPPPARTGKKMTPVNWVMGVGVALIILAGLVFATTSWLVLPPVGRITLLLLLTVVFFGISVLFEKVLKLVVTGKAFYFLGCLFCFVVILAGGYFEFFGSWFSTHGQGRDFLVGLGLFLVALPACFGFYRYNSRLFAWLSGLCLQGAVYSSVLGCGARETGAMVLQIVAFTFFALGLWAKKSTAEETTKTRMGKILAFTRLNFVLVSGYVLLTLIFEGLASVQSLVAQLFIIAGIKLFGLVGKKHIAWKLLPPPILLFFISLVDFLPLAYFGKVLCMVVLTLVGFWTFRLIKVPEAGRIKSVVSDLVFLGWAVVYSVFHSASFIRAVPVSRVFISNGYTPLAGMLGMALVCLTFVALALGNKDSVIARISSWIVGLIPLFLHIEMYYTFSPLGLGVYEIQTALYSALYYVFLFVAAGLAVLFALVNTTPQGKRLEIPTAVGLLLFVLSSLQAENMYGANWQMVKLMAFGVGSVYGGWQLWRYQRGKGAFGKSFSRAKILVLVESVLLLAFSILFAKYISGDKTQLVSALISLATALLLAILAIRPIKSPAEGPVTKIYGWFWLVVSQAVLFISMFEYYIDTMLIPPTEFWQCGVLLFAALVVGYASVTVRGKNLFGMLLPAGAYILLFAVASRIFGEKLEVLMAVSGGIFILYTIAGRLLFSQVFSIGFTQPDGKPEKMTLDAFTITAVITPLFWIFSSKELYTFIGLLLLGVWFLLFVGRLTANQATGKEWLGTGATISVMLALLNQPFAEWPDMVSLEITLLIVILAALALRFLVWNKRAPAVLNQLLFGVACVSFMVQGFSALVSSYVWDGLLIGGIALIMAIVSFVLRRRKWFVLGMVNLIGVVLYQSRWFWLSIAWWVYLLVAGALLITLAALNEAYKKQGSSLGLRLRSSVFFTQWRG